MRETKKPIPPGERPMNEPYEVLVKDIPVVPPKEVVIRMPLDEARRVMTDITELGGNKIAAWRLFGAMQEAGVTPTYVSRETKL